MLTDFHNFFASRFPQKLFLDSFKNCPPHPKCVATLSCEIRMFKITTTVRLYFFKKITVACWKSSPAGSCCWRHEQRQQLFTASRSMTTPSYHARQVDCRWRCAGDVGDGERVYEHGDRDRPLPGRRAAPQAARQPPTPARAHLGPGRCPVVRTARRRTQQHRTGDQIFWPDHPVLLATFSSRAVTVSAAGTLYLYTFVLSTSYQPSNDN